MADSIPIRIVVNGIPRDALVEPRTTLADFLRHGLGLTGTHVGCEHGVCGSCNVLLGGRAVRSCLMLAVQADGAEVRTVESLAEPDGTLHPIQEAFRETRGLQCGFCTPGMLAAIHELLADDPDPSEETIREVLGGQLCRCTGYQPIVEAVRVAAAKLRAPAGSEG